MTLSRLLSIFAFKVVICSVISSIDDSKKACTSLPAEELNAIFRSTKLEKFYLRVREHNKKSYESENEIITDVGIRNRICGSVLRTAAQHKLIKNMEPRHVDQWFGTQHWGSKFSNQDLQLKKEFEFFNEKRMIHLGSVDEDVEEYAFMCVGLFQSEEYRGYLLSEEYNVNFASMLYIPARFIFTLNAEGEISAPYLLATKSASVIEDSRNKLKHLYLESRQGVEIAAAAEDDPVCRLNENARTHICSSIVNSSYFHGIGEYLYPYSTRETKCIREEVSLEDDVEDRVHATDPTREWMIDCQASVRVKGREEDAFELSVSRGTDEDNFFVYTCTQRKSKLCHLAYLSENILEYLVHIT